jgi:hypothetical protein
MCACKDAACGQAVQQDVARWTSEVAASGPKSDKPTKEQEGKLGEIVVQLNDCLARLQAKP